VGNAARTGAYFQQRLRETVAPLPLVGEVRGVGLMGGVELAADRAARQAFDPALKVAQRVAARCLEDGLIIRALPVGGVLTMSPPLCITRAEVDQVVDGLARALGAVAEELRHEGSWSAT
jgi:L-2,4-diaminobutyrate transaminase